MPSPGKLILTSSNGSIRLEGVAAQEAIALEKRFALLRSRIFRSCLLLVARVARVCPLTDFARSRASFQCTQATLFLCVAVAQINVNQARVSCSERSLMLNFSFLSAQTGF